ncbi:MAG: T9SS type A sorting domain-containing protein [Bacteroidetes bacterium]|nr:T9SS type A sorting domain-containing protein [Bacteroidota bacterium]
MASKTLAFFIFIFLMVIYLTKFESAVQREEPSGKIPGNPAYMKELLEMKANKDGVIPFGVWKSVRDEYNSKTRGVSALTNITEVGPENVGGRTRAFVIDYDDPSHFIVGGVSGGIWESFDKGETWDAIGDYAATLSVTYITQDPDSTNIFYFSTGESTGNSSGLGSAGVFKSTDGAKTFTQLSATNNSNFIKIWSIKASLAELNTIYVATADKGLFKSTNGGLFFTQVFVSGTDDINDIEVFADSSVVIGVRKRGVFKSPNGNAGTFVQLTNGLPINAFKRVEVAYCDSFPNNIYAQFEDSGSSNYYTSNKGVWKSIDAGANWIQTANPDSDHFIDYLFPWYCFMFEVSPIDPDFVISGGQRAAFTMNGGNSWTELQYSHFDYHIAVFDHQNADTFYVGNDGGLASYHVNTASSSHVSLNNNYNVTQFYAGAYFPWGVNAFGGTQDNGTQATRNANQTFDHVMGGDGAFTQIKQQNQNVAYASYQNGIIRKTYNAQAQFPSWQNVLNQLDGNNDGSIDEGAIFINPFYMNALDGDQLYYVTKQSIWRTANGATTWTRLTDTIGKAVTGKRPYAVGLSNSQDPIMYIGGEKMLFFRSDFVYSSGPGMEQDLYSSHPPNDSISFIACLKVHPNDSSIVYAGLSNYSYDPRIYKIIDGTTSSPTWIDISGDLPTLVPVNWVEVNPVDPDSFIIIGTDYGVYTTINGGTNWVIEDSIPFVPIAQIHVRPNDGKVFIFTHGRGLWTAQLPGVFTNTQNIYQNELDVKLFPNPAGEVIYFTLQGQIEQELDLRIYDIDGILVYENIHSLSNVNAIDISSLSRGIYFLKVTNGNQLNIQKFIKI